MNASRRTRRRLIGAAIALALPLGLGLTSCAGGSSDAAVGAQTASATTGRTDLVVAYANAVNTLDP